MPRIARAIAVGCAHHITQRGNNRQDVFFVDEDRQVYLELLQEQAQKYGAKVSRNSSGLVQTVQSSWSTEHYAYDDGGLLKKAEIEKNGRKASAEWQSGLIRKVVPFDGGETLRGYCEAPARKSLPREVRTPNDTRLSYGCATRANGS